MEMLISSNTDDECFKWSILAALHYNEVFAKNKNKANDATSYQLWADELNFNGINFPVRLNQIKKFMNRLPLMYIIHSCMII